MTGLVPFTRGVDYSGAPITGSDVAAEGSYRFVGRYTAGVGNQSTVTDWKTITPDEAAQLDDAGLDVFLFSEWYAGRVTEGYAAGLADGQADYELAQSCGLKKGVGLVPSWDEGQPNAALHPMLAAYLRGYRKAVRGFYAVGLYAGDVAGRAMLKAGAVDFTVRAEAESWSVDEPAGAGWYQPGADWLAAAKAVQRVSPATLWQNGNMGFGNGADEEVALLSFAHGSRSSQGRRPNPKPVPVPPPPPPPPAFPTTLYVVQPHDTLSGIAARYSTSVRRLITLNKTRHPNLALNPDLLITGWKLVVPDVPPRTSSHKIHQVVKGESLSRIASRSHTTVTQLLAWNVTRYPGLHRRPGHIEPGMRLRVG